MILATARAQEKGKACPFAHGKEELRPSTLSENITAPRLAYSDLVRDVRVKGHVQSVQSWR